MSAARRRSPLLCPTLSMLAIVAALAGCGDDDAGSDDDDDAADAGVDADASLDPDADVAPTCAERKPLPVEVEELSGFTGAEDFAFDDEGRYVAVNELGDLVRIAKDGTTTLWVPNVGGAGSIATAGTGFLANGDLIIAVVDNGALVRISPDGGTRVLVTGLEYPNGLDIGPDGMVYVAENDGGRVRRVDPDTGEFTIVATGLWVPNGVAFGPDPDKLFVGSFGGGVIYQITLGDVATAGTGEVSVFGRTPDAPDFPEPVDACEGLVAGDECVTQFGESGTCQDFGGVIDCFRANTCEGKSPGDRCEIYGGDGTCEEGAFGSIVCAYAFPCHDQEPGETCTGWSGLGVCYYDEEYQYTDCVSPCFVAGLAPGDACTTPLGAPGTCVDGYFGVDCLAPTECTAQGAACTTPDGFTGTCDAATCIADDPCAGAKAGASCFIDHELEGSCVAGDGGLVCERIEPCADAVEGDFCEIKLGYYGTCTTVDEVLTCVPELAALEDACDSLALGDPCTVNAFDTEFTGVCGNGPATLLCGVWGDYVGPCVDAAVDDPCSVVDPAYGPFDGVCVDYGDGVLFCEGGGGTWDAGGLDGLGVDACGHVYVTEFVLGKVWRFPPDGSTVELVAQLPSDWIPNMHWGTGAGGFARDVLYVADRLQGRLFGLDLGVEGAPEPYPPADGQ
jgi:sugar lactone lactonase YvrE